MPALDFIADMNISPLTVSQLKERGWNVLRVSEIMDVRTADIDILNYARDENKVVITCDPDFSELLAIQMNPFTMSGDGFRNRRNIITKNFHLIVEDD